MVTGGCAEVISADRATPSNVTKLLILNKTLPTGSVQIPYTVSLSATGGKAPYGWNLASAQLPPGLTLSTDGAITGKPTLAGKYAFAVEVKDSGAPAEPVFQSFDTTILTPEAALAITTTTLPGGVQASPYSATLTASGGILPYKWSIISGSLPGGLSLNSGQISGTPSLAGDFSVVVQVTDSSPTVQTASKSLIVVVGSAAAPLKITTNSLPVGTQDQNYSASLSVTGGTPPYAWSIALGSLPAGVSFGSYGQVSGVPVQAGNFSVVVQVTDSSSKVQTASKSLIVVVGSAVAPLKITTNSLPVGTQDQNYSASLSVTGGTPPYAWSIALGSLPAGVSFGSYGQVNGVPVQAGNFAFTVQVKDSSQVVQTVAKSLGIVVQATTTPLQVITNVLSNGQIGANYSGALIVTGGIPPYTWTIGSGSLPSGLQLQASLGSITGVPSQSGTFSVKIQAQDSSASPQTATKTYSIAIGAQGSGSPLTSCQILANSGTVYDLQNDVSSTGSCFNVQANNISLNLNGHTITYSDSAIPPSMSAFGIYGAASWDPNFTSGGLAEGNATGGSWNNLTVAGPGTITQGNCLAPSNIRIGSNAIHIGQGAGDGLAVFQVTFNICADSTQAIFSDSSGAGVSVHDNIVNDKVVTAQKRSIFQGVAFVCNGCQGDHGATSNFFNNTITGGPQGCIIWNNPNTNLYSNLCSHGNPNGWFTTPSTSLVCDSNPYTNASGTLPANGGTQCSNDFGLYGRGVGGSIFGNTVTPLEGRGIFIGAGNGMALHDNVVNGARELHNNSEYAGCEIGGAYGIQLDDNGNNETFYKNSVTAISSLCAASALRVTDSESYTNISHDNQYVAQRAPNSPSTCSGFINNQNCAYAVSFDGTDGPNPLQFTSQNDSFTGDSALLFFDWTGPANQALFLSPTFAKGPNADSNFFHFAVFRNGGGTINTHIRDAVFGPGVSPTDTFLPTQSPNNQAVSMYIDWTITLTVHNMAGTPINGASIIYLNALSNQECSAITDSAGKATCILTQYRINNDTGANQVENHNPFSFTISAPGCMTATGQDSLIAPTSEIKQLAGC